MSDAPELQMSDGQMHGRTDGQTNDGATTSTGQTTPAAPAAGENRRSVPRRRVERLAYIRFDQDNGGILLDIGEGGLKFQGVASSLEGEFCIVKFMLPGSGRTIEVRGQIAWSNKSRKGGGVRFVDIPEDVRQQIREWMAQENTPLISTRPVAKPIVSKPPQFLTRERVKAGITASLLSQPVMPSLSSAPTVPLEPVVPVAPSVRVAAVPVPEMRAEDRAVLSSLPIESIIPAAERLDSVVPSAKAEVPAALGQSAVSAPIPISVPPQAVGGERSEMLALVAEDVRTTKPAKSLPSRFRGITQQTAMQLPAPVSGQTLHTNDWPDPATLPQSESFIAADLSALKYGQPKGTSRVAQTVMVVAFVCAAAVAAVVVTPRTPALLASFRGISQASGSAPVDAPVPLAGAGQDFTVDAVDSSNRHSTLRNGGVGDSTVASLGAASNDVSGASPNSVAGASHNVSNNPSSNAPGDLSGNVTVPGNENARGNVSAAAAQQVEASKTVAAEPKIKAIMPPPAAQHLDLRPPKTRQVASSPSGLEAPSVAENAPSANLLESRSLVPVAPSLPAPPPVAAAASAPVTATASSVSKSALRPPVLIHSVRAVYPHDISAGKSATSVRVSAVIDKEGVPGSLTMVGGDPSLLEAAFAAVHEYRYDPALLNGVPVESTVVIAVNFQQTK